MPDMITIHSMGGGVVERSKPQGWMRGGEREEAG